MNNHMPKILLLFTSMVILQASIVQASLYKPTVEKAVSPYKILSALTGRSLTASSQPHEIFSLNEHASLSEIQEGYKKIMTSIEYLKRNPETQAEYRAVNNIIIDAYRKMRAPLLKASQKPSNNLTSTETPMTR